MGVTLEELRRLQAVEMQLAALRRDRESKSRQVEIHGRQIRQIDEKLQENHRKARECQMRLDALSLEVASREESAGRHRQALNKAKTNKEYAAILTAINTEKADSFKVETGIFQLMEELAAIKTEGVAIEADRDKLLAHAAASEEALKAFDAQSQQERESLETGREEFARKLTPQAIDMFNRVAQRHDGEAMAPVTKLRPKRDEWACGGCNMKVALEVVNALQTRDEILLCTVCGRILYLEAPAIHKPARA
jgi:predicted  nucleic acid-binding Zn-ribbon protein